MSDWDELEKLNELYQKGIFNEREYEFRKKAILNANIAEEPREKEMLSMGKAYKRYWKKSFVWQGRATRAEYWWPILINGLISFFIQSVAIGTVPFLIIVFALFSFASIFPTMAVYVRRMHDVNKSAWFAFMPLWTMILIMGGTLSQSFLLILISLLVLVVMSIVLFVYLVLPGTKGDNRYGHPQ